MLSRSSSSRSSSQYRVAKIGGRRQKRLLWRRRVVTGLGVALLVGVVAWALPRREELPYMVTSGASHALGAPVAEGRAFIPVVYDASVKEEKVPAAPPYRGPWNDKIVYLGMNSGPTRRATRALQDQAEVHVITNAGRSDFWNGFNLGNARGRREFVASLSLPAQNAAGVSEALADAEDGARDELAQLAAIWARGQKGGNIPSRLVLAGHSNGDGVWGDNNGSLRLGPLLTLARALPGAAVQIEDAFVTGCYSGGEVTMDQYLLIFPRAKTIWAYEAQAPGVDNGATVDQAGWERATRGRNAAFVPTRSAVANKKLAVWSARSGYHATRPPLNLHQMRGKVQWMEETFFLPALEGKTHTFDGGWRIPLRITEPHTGLVRQYYSWLVRLTQRRDLPPEESAFWNEKKHQTIRLLYYRDTVAPRFMRAHGTLLRRAYQKMGISMPDYAELDRASALREIRRASDRASRLNGNAPEVSRALSLLERGLRDLDPSVIPDGWV